MMGHFTPPANRELHDKVSAALDRRSSMFFEADLMAAADGAAFAMECHGLTPAQVEALSEEIQDTIRDCFRKIEDVDV